MRASGTTLWRYGSSASPQVRLSLGSTMHQKTVGLDCAYWLDIYCLGAGGGQHRHVGFRHKWPLLCPSSYNEWKKDEQTLPTNLGITGASIASTLLIVGLKLPTGRVTLAKYCKVQYLICSFSFSHDNRRLTDERKVRMDYLPLWFCWCVIDICLPGIWRLQLSSSKVPLVLFVGRVSIRLHLFHFTLNFTHTGTQRAVRN